MIPVASKNKTHTVPLMNLLLISFNLIVFLYELVLPDLQLARFILAWGTVPKNILAGLANPLASSWLTWLPLMTAQFLHGGWFHLIGNMLFLWVFGNSIEDALGMYVYLIFYLVCGIGADLVWIFFEGPSKLPAIGASGAISGILGAYLVLYPWSRIRILIPSILLIIPIEVPALMVLGWWFIQQFFYGMAVLSSTAGAGIAYWAHIGGFAVGMLLILPFVPWVRRQERQSSYYYPY
jgi:membrane associated rhomboid family serine protease